MWEIRSIRALQELAKLNVLGITRLRWMILMALTYLGKRKGCTVQPGITIDARRPLLCDNPL
jgi:hypothetical protein